MTDIEKLVIDRIKKEGPISFRDFMEMALYQPELGYYSSGKNTVGMEGDFFTSATVSPLFGNLIGKQLLEMWDVLGTDEFAIVEFGAGSGALCKAILSFFRTSTTKASKLRYLI